MNKYALGALAIVLLAGGFFYVSKIRQTPSVSQTPEPASPTMDIEGESYSNEIYGYSITIPEGYEVQEMSDESIQILKSEQAMGQGPANFIYVSVVPEEKRNGEVGTIYNYYPDQYAKFAEAEDIQDSVNLVADESPDLADWYSYMLVSMVVIDGNEFSNFQNDNPWEFPAGTTENRYIYDDGENIYILGYYTGGIEGIGSIDPREAYSILQSFRIN